MRNIPTGSAVLVILITGAERIEQRYPGIVIGSAPTLDDDHPALDIAYLAPKRASALGTPDWRNAFDRLFAVKHKSHDDVAEQRESACYEEVLLATFEKQPAPLGTFPTDPPAQTGDLQGSGLSAPSEPPSTSVAGDESASGDSAPSPDAPDPLTSEDTIKLQLAQQEAATSSGS